MNSIDCLLSFELIGPVAQFKKYYSNISALSYEIPPRTAIAGILASILECPRDSYYDIFAPRKSKFTVQLLNPVRKYMAYTNYRNPKEGSTIQTRVELLFPLPNYQNIRYKIFFAHQEQEVFNKLLTRLQNGYAGFGIYLGQRQFRASIKKVEEFESPHWKTNYEGAIHSATWSDNIISINNVADHQIESCSMPVQMAKANIGREPKLYDEIVYETGGKELKGNFKEVLQLPETNIAFMTKTAS